MSVLASRYLTAVETHFAALLTQGRPQRREGNFSAMWMSAVDLRTGTFPTTEPAAGKRVYRNIDAPRGCSLYWDQPAIAAARLLGRTGRGHEAATATEAYISEFLERSCSATGLFLWGNHYFYRPDLDSVVKFHVDEEPFAVVPADEAGELHEARPITPLWTAFWEVSPRATREALRAMGRHHVFDAATGGFNRHADQRCDHAFIEAGGVLVESLAWLAAKDGDADTLDLARRIAHFSFSHRGAATGLLENNPTTNRWDKHVATTECGLWAGCLLRAAELTDAAELRDLAVEVVEAYLRFGYDVEAQTYAGMVRVADGERVRGLKETIYQPDDHVDFWHPLFPRHDYPFQFAGVCCDLLVQTGKPLFAEACRRWATALEQALQTRGDRPIYAEHYGRAIHLLLQLGRVLDAPALVKRAHSLADEALSTLGADRLFRGHTTEARYEAVDGVGYLCLALLELSGAIDRSEPELQQFF